MAGGLLRIAVVAGISAVVLAGCGRDGGTASPAKSSSSSKPPAVDLSTLDTGKYLTLPRRLGQVASEEEGRMAEAIRMAEALADLTKVDPTFAKDIERQPLVSPSDVANIISFTDQAVVQPVLVKYGMIAGHVVQGSSAKMDSGAQPAEDYKAVVLMLVRFADEASARNAAVEMDAVDFAVSPENVPVPVTKYPAAHGHWRPSNPTMASTLAHGDFVIHVIAANPTPNLETLTGMVATTFDKEIAALDRFQPTPVNQIGKLSKDPDGLLGRLVDLTPGTEPSLSKSVASYGPNGAATTQNERQMKDRVYENAGVDRLAIWLDPKLGGSSIFRARDRDAAVKLMDALVSTDDDIDHPIDGVRGLPDAKCFEQKQSTYKDAPGLRFECYVTYDRYVAGVASGDEADVRQRAAAQYALLVNPL